MRSLLINCVFLTICIGLSGQTPVPPGPISGVWTANESPYLIEGVNTIEDGTTLTIHPGVTVEWQNDSCPMWVNGRIVAEGTELDSIKFIALDSDAGWGSIRFYSTPITNDSSSFKYCLFENGKVFGDIPDNSGGALGIMEFDKVIIDHCSFINNKAEDINIYSKPIGGAIAMRNASPTISNCIFKNNSCYAGGAVGCYLGSSPEIENNVFTGNDAIGDQYAQGYGGAICCYVLCSPIISNNSFTGNWARNGGGAIGMVSRCDPIIDHNLFFGNTSVWIGGAIEVQDTCSPYILNNTIIFNEADLGGGIDFWDSTHAIVRNNILWGNTAPNGSQVYLKDTQSQPDFEYCDIEGGQPGIGGVPHTGKYIECIDVDPIFSGPPDYYITWANAPEEDSTKSPCIDFGCPTMTDPDGTRCDIGYCYFDQYWVGLEEPGHLSSDLNMKIFPNPTSGKLDIRYTISNMRSVCVTVVDMTGKQIKAMVNEARIPGEQSLEINVGDLPDGVYFIRLSTGSENAVRKLLIRH